MKKIFSIIISLLMVCMFTLTACNTNDTPHRCSSKCSVCQLCTDEDCTDSACSNKCQGHTPAPGTHTCESVCPICQKCTDASCSEAVCADKCLGHNSVEDGVLEFVTNTANYLAEAHDGISAAVEALGGSVDLSYENPIFPSGDALSASIDATSSGDDDEEMMPCGKCGEVMVTVSQKYCDACRAAMDGEQIPAKQYSWAEQLEQYILFNSIARKIKLIVGATEYYTEYDFPFPTEEETALVGTIKFEGEFTKLLKEIDQYDISADADDFYILEELRYEDGLFDPETGNLDKEQEGKTLVSKTVRGYKYSGNTLTTTYYTVIYDLYDGSEIVSDVVYVDYTLDGNNFYYEKYTMEQGQKVVVDMFDIVKSGEASESEETVYYVQMMLYGEEITGEPAVYFEEAMDIADQWTRYVDQQMGTGNHQLVPTKAYVNASIRTLHPFVVCDMYYFRDYDYVVGGYESSCEIISSPENEWDEQHYEYVYTRGESAGLPTSWKEGYTTDFGANLEGMIEESLFEKYAETLIFRAIQQVELSVGEKKYSPFKLKENSTMMDVNDQYEIVSSYADDVTYSYFSSNESIASVSDWGNITTGNTEGEAVITVMRGKLVRYFYVSVRAELVVESPEEMIVRYGTDEHAIFNAYSNQNLDVTFSSDNEEIVTIDETGYMTIHAIGTTMVRATASTGKEATMVVRAIDMVEFEGIDVYDEETETWVSIGAWSYRKPYTGKTIVNYDVVLQSNTDYHFKFVGIDTEGQSLGVFRFNGEVQDPAIVVSEWYDDPESGTIVWNHRNINFKTAGAYKITVLYPTQSGWGWEYINGEQLEYGIGATEEIVLEINVTVDQNFTYRFDQESNTYFVKDYDGLIAWYEAQKLDKTLNLTLEADITMANYYSFDLDLNGQYDSNWGADTLKYEGVVDGQGHSIIGLFMWQNTVGPKIHYNSLGFVSSLTNGGVVKNLNMVGGQIHINGRAGGIVGSIGSGCAVINCTNRNLVEATTSSGGIASSCYGTIMACINYADITPIDGGYAGAGGITADATTTRGLCIVACINYGNVSGGRWTNGVVGNANYATRLYGTFNSGTITTDSDDNAGYAIAVTTLGNPPYYGACYYTEGQGHSKLNYVDGTTITYEQAMEAINAEIEKYNNNSYYAIDCEYRFVLNTDPETSEAYPLILQEVTDAQ